MENEHQDPIRKLKQEADEIFFEDLHFDNTLKEKVKQNIDFNPKKSNKNSYNPNRNKMFISLATVAAIILLIVFTPSLINNELAQPPVEQIEQPETFLVVDDMVGERTDTGTTIDYDRNLTDAQLLLDLQTQLADTDEAKAWFGQELLLAEYIPDRFELEAIFALGEKASENVRVEFTYSSGTEVFMIIQNKLNETPPFFGEQIEINGNKGYINSRQLNSEMEWTQLSWFSDEIYVLLSGEISEEEAIKVAKSLK